MKTLLDYCRGKPLKTFADGICLINEGTNANSIYVLFDGCIRIYKNGTFITNVTNRGAIIGEISILLKLPHSATCVSYGDSSLYEIELDPNKIEAQPGLLACLARDLAYKLNNATTKLSAAKNENVDIQNNQPKEVKEHFDAILKELYG